MKQFSRLPNKHVFDLFLEGGSVNNVRVFNFVSQIMFGMFVNLAAVVSKAIRNASILELIYHTYGLSDEEQSQNIQQNSNLLARELFR